MNRLAIRWTQHLQNKDQKLEFEKAFRNTIDMVVFKRLIEILEQDLESLSHDSPDYDSPSWAFKQAHENGKIEAIKNILLLLKGRE